MKKFTAFLSLFFFIILLSFPRPAGADTYYVSPSGSDSLGNGSLLNPWLTITHALNSISGSAANPHTIFVEQGTYSPSATGETFPLVMENYVSLQGAGDSLSVLDAEAVGNYFELRRVITCSEVSHITIDGFTIKNGYYGVDSTFTNPSRGGGILILKSSFITISNNRIANNYADKGGGIACDSSSYVLTTGNLISQNFAGIIVCSGLGGGIAVYSSTGLISNNLIKYNGADGDAGGIFLDNQSINLIINNEITDNGSTFLGGGIVTKGTTWFFRNYILRNWINDLCGPGAGGGGIYCARGVIGGSIKNGNNIYDNSGHYFPQPFPYGNQLKQFAIVDSIDSRYNYFGNHNPHDPEEVYGNFIIDPYLITTTEFDTLNLIVVPSPVDFDTVVVNDTKTLKLRFFNVTNSLFDSLEVFDIAHHDTSFSISKTAFIIPPINEDTLTAIFSPAAEGSFSDTLNIIYTGGELKVALRGIAVDTSTVIADDLPKLPLRFALHQNYPNPFNAITRIRFDLPSRSEVTLKIYNIMGQEVQNLIQDKLFPAGVHEIDFDAASLSSGLYFYRLQSGNFSKVRKMMLIH